MKTKFKLYSGVLLLTTTLFLSWSNQTEACPSGYTQYPAFTIQEEGGGFVTFCPVGGHSNGYCCIPNGPIE